ncbi:ABC transporter permease [Nitrospira defluvii]|nr:ABC transporter permease [Nitrospira defluvii]
MSFLAAMQELLRHPLRSALSVLGVVIGVASLVATLAIGEGARRSATQGIRELGANLIFIRPGKARMGYAWLGNVKTLKYTDAEALRRISGVTAAVPEVFARTQVKYLNKNTDSRVFGVTPDYFDILRYRLSQGARFTEADVRAARRVALLGSKTAESLFRMENPVGKFIKVKGKNFRVIGVLEERGERAGLMEADDRVIIPVTSYQKRLFGGDLVRSLLVQVDDALHLDQTIADITKRLRRRHRLRPGAEDDFHIALQTEVLQTMAMVSRTFSLLLGSVSGITLLVGGVGIMNIMLVSVSERTGEIGLRRAVGATQADIRRQFLSESVAVSLTGALLGLLLGVGAGYGMASMAGWTALFSISAFTIPLIFSVGIGIIFGLYPAVKASRLDPAEALRHG